jgi:hypothetical protein
MRSFQINHNAALWHQKRSVHFCACNGLNRIELASVQHYRNSEFDEMKRKGHAKAAADAAAKEAHVYKGPGGCQKIVPV